MFDPVSKPLDGVTGAMVVCHIEVLGSSSNSSATPPCSIFPPKLPNLNGKKRQKWHMRGIYVSGGSTSHLWVYSV